MEGSDDIIMDMTRTLNEALDEGNKLRAEIERMRAENQILSIEKEHLSETIQGNI